jgi:hypothetical protein
MAFNPNDTQYVKRVARIRSRHMIPMEMLAFLTLMVAGLSGAFVNGYLHIVLSADGQALWWGLALMPIAGAGLIVAAAEWWIGHAWENGMLRGSIWVRMWLSGLAFIMWIYVLYVMATLPSGPVTSMVISACFVSPFHLWSWWVNYRVHCALDPKMKTEKLGRRLETTRDRW